MAWSRERQIEILRQTAAGPGLDWVFGAMILAAVACVVIAAWLRQIGFLLFAFFPALVAMSCRQTGPLIRQAAVALDAGERQAGVALIELTRWTDSDSYHATIADRAGRRWHFEFIPQGWTPVAGPLEVDAYFVPGQDWPALLSGAEGIFYPRSRPDAVDAGDGEQAIARSE